MHRHSGIHASPLRSPQPSEEEVLAKTEKLLQRYNSQAVMSEELLQRYKDAAVRSTRELEKERENSRMMRVEFDIQIETLKQEYETILANVQLDAKSKNENTETMRKKDEYIRDVESRLAEEIDIKNAAEGRSAYFKLKYEELEDSFTQAQEKWTEQEASLWLEIDKLKGSVEKVAHQKAEELIVERLTNFEQELARIYMEKEQKMIGELESQRAVMMIEVHEMVKKEREEFELDRASFTKMRRAKNQLEQQVQELKESIQKKDEGNLDTRIQVEKDYDKLIRNIMKDLEREKEKFQKELNNRSVDVDSIKEDFWKQKTLLEGEIAHHKQTINKLEEELRKNVSTNSIVASPEATPQQANPNQSGNDELEDLKSRYDSDLHAKDYIISSLREQINTIRKEMKDYVLLQMDSQRKDLLKAHEDEINQVKILESDIRHQLEITYREQIAALRKKVEEYREKEVKPLDAEQIREEYENIIQSLKESHAKEVAYIKEASVTVQHRARSESEKRKAFQENYETRFQELQKELREQYIGQIEELTNKETLLQTAFDQQLEESERLRKSLLKEEQIVAKLQEHEKNLIESHKFEMESFRYNMELELEKLQQKDEVTIAQEMRILENTEDQIIKKYKQKKEKAKEEHRKEIEALQRKHQSEIEQLARDSATQIRDLTNDFTERMKQTQENDTSISKVKQAYKAYIAKMKEEIKDIYHDEIQALKKIVSEQEELLKDYRIEEEKERSKLSKRIEDDLKRTEFKIVDSRLDSITLDDLKYNSMFIDDGRLLE